MTSLGQARAEERRCREALAELVAEHRSVLAEVERLTSRAALADAVEDMALSADRQRVRAESLDAQIQDARRALRVSEAAVARLEADADGA